MLIKRYIEEIASYKQNNIDWTEFAGMILKNEPYHDRIEAVSEIMYGIEDLIADYLVNPTNDNIDDLLAKLRINAERYYKKRMKNLLEEEQEDQECAAHEAHGCCSYRDEQTGERIWRKHL